MHEIPPSSESSSLKLPPPPDESSILEILKSLKEEGEAFNKADPSLAKIDDVMRYIQGEQNSPGFILNQLKKVVNTHVSALTDMRPLFAWKTFNPNYAQQSYLLNQLTVIWWVNSVADEALAEIIQYSLAGGSGYANLEYDPFFMEGDTRMTSIDPRDILPIRPERSRSLQDWEGLTHREVHSVDRLRARFPDQIHKIKEDTGRLGTVFSRLKRMVLGPSHDGGAMSILEARRNPAKSSVFPEVTLYKTWFKDRSYNLSGHPLLIGIEGANSSYIVPPGKPLYPRGRLIVWTEHGKLWDGPNPYWHGLFPYGRLRLNPWPWLFSGLGIAHDLLPLQDTINYTGNKIKQNFTQHVDRGSVWDRNTPESVMHRFNPTQPNWKIRRPNAIGEGMRLAEVPPLPQYTFPFFQQLLTKFDELGETANLQALMQLRQMPGSETIEKYMEALTPGIRREARQIEIFLRDVALMLKGNIFQFQSTARRMMMLGEQGAQLQDIDFDPNTLVPAMLPGEPGYVPELDAEKPRDVRARFFMGQFAFYVSPNSMLALHAQERKLMYLQLSRMGYLDLWTLMEMLEIPNVGNPPAMPLPPVNWKMPTMEELAMGASPQPPIEVRVPQTITEKLIAQQQLGIGMEANAAGRKASGQAPPKMEQKSDGRPTITESK